MGVVYRARDLALDRLVAIKVVSSEFVEVSEERFYREARAQARLNHPNVCHIYYVGEEGGELFFAMELVDGQSVSELIEENGQLSPPRALEIVRQAALGLREAQMNGIVHRDVKPSNLMVDRHGIVKVMDFGIAKQSDQLTPSDDANSGPVEQTSIAGTPLFAAPEQLKGGAIDHRADIYALGATLHQMLTGAAPFRADSVEELTRLHQTESRPTFVRKVVGQRDLLLLNRLADRMMAKRPDDRFDTYDDLLQALEFAEPSASRPARFGVRAMAALIDGLILLILTNIVALALPMFISGPVFCVITFGYVAVLLTRFGTTTGCWLLGIEVTSVRGGRGLGLHAAIVRCSWQLGPLVLFALLWSLGETLPSRPAKAIGAVGIGASIFINVVHVAFISLRSSAARTFWDLRSGTQVRYLAVRGTRGVERLPAKDSQE